MSHLTSPTSTYERGIETATFYLHRDSLRAIASLAEKGKLHLHRFFAGVYLAEPQPSPREIISSSLALEDGRVRVELKIQRGHYILAALLKERGELPEEIAEESIPLTYGMTL